MSWRQVTSRVWRLCSCSRGGWATTCFTPMSPRVWSWSCPGSASGSSRRLSPPGSRWGSPPSSLSPPSTQTVRSLYLLCHTSRFVNSWKNNFLGSKACISNKVHVLVLSWCISLCWISDWWYRSTKQNEERIVQDLALPRNILNSWVMKLRLCDKWKIFSRKSPYYCLRIHKNNQSFFMKKMRFSYKWIWLCIVINHDNSLTKSSFIFRPLTCLCPPARFSCSSVWLSTPLSTWWWGTSGKQKMIYCYK